MLDQNIKFRLSDRMLKIGFSSGLGSLEQRRKIVDNFIDRHYGKNPHFEEWLAITENNDSLQSPGAFFRKMVSTGAVPNDVINQRSGFNN